MLLRRWSVGRLRWWARFGGCGSLDLKVGDPCDINVDRVGVEDRELIAVLFNQSAPVLCWDRPVLERSDEVLHVAVHAVERWETSRFRELGPVDRGAVVMVERAEEWLAALVPTPGLIESTTVFTLGAVGGRELPVVGVCGVFFEFFLVEVLEDKQLCFGVCCIAEIPCTGSLLLQGDAGFVGVWKEVKEVEC